MQLSATAAYVVRLDLTEGLSDSTHANRMNATTLFTTCMTCTDMLSVGIQDSRLDALFGASTVVVLVV